MQPAGQDWGIPCHIADGWPRAPRRLLAFDLIVSGPDGRRPVASITQVGCPVTESFRPTAQQLPLDGLPELPGMVAVDEVRQLVHD